MITDKIKYLSTYEGIAPQIRLVSEFLERNDLDKFPVGKHFLNDSKCFVLVFEYNTKAESEALWEAHQKFLDVHLLASGEEKVFYSGIDDKETTSTVPYEPNDDYELFSSSGNSLKLSKDNFVLFFPQDVHKTGVNVDDRAVQVRKFVFKLEIL